MFSLPYISLVVVLYYVAGELLDDEFGAKKRGGVTIVGELLDEEFGTKKRGGVTIVGIRARLIKNRDL
ncbi:hypothetical protein Fmac_018775 [Flemingia macrophylla]|uniref:Uncharacterized protein n=1 Tax=Flemingia macrophylla TaxID=520843 RepID=A0ABD1M5X5_9FABA